MSNAARKRGVKIDENLFDVGRRRERRLRA